MQSNTRKICSLLTLRSRNSVWSQWTAQDTASCSTQRWEAIKIFQLDMLTLVFFIGTSSLGPWLGSPESDAFSKMMLIFSADLIKSKMKSWWIYDFWIMFINFLGSITNSNFLQDLILHWVTLNCGR